MARFAAQLPARVGGDETLLPCGLREHAAAPTPTTGPRDLGRARASGRVEGETRAADRDHVRRAGRVRAAVAAVSGRGGDGNAGVVVIAVVERVEARFRTGVAVADRVRAQGHGAVLGGAEIAERRRAPFDEQDLALRADRRRHLDVEVDLLSPPDVARRQLRLGRLPDLREAARRGRARREPERAAVRGEVGGRIRIVVGVDDRDRPSVPRPGRTRRATRTRRRATSQTGRSQSARSLPAASRHRRR